MADPQDKTTRRSRSATPSEFPTTAPQTVYPSGDYSYILEIVMNMQSAMGRLEEAVNSLKSQMAENSKELRSTSSDVKTAKVVASVVGTILVGAIGLVGWIAKAYLDYVMANGHKP